jgi:hypothetical protein
LFLEDQPDPYYYLECLTAWGSFEHTLFIASPSCIDTSILAKVASNWTFVCPPENSRIALPLSLEDKDTSVVGMALALTSSVSLPGDTPDAPPLPPLPAIFVYNNAGWICAYWVMNGDEIRGGTRCSGMVDKVLPIPPPSAEDLARQSNSALESDKPTRLGGLPSKGVGASSQTNTSNVEAPPSRLFGDAAATPPKFGFPASATADAFSPFGAPFGGAHSQATSGPVGSSGTPATESKLFFSSNSKPDALFNKPTEDAPRPSFRLGSSTNTVNPFTASKLPSTRENDQSALGKFSTVQPQPSALNPSGKQIGSNFAQKITPTQKYTESASKNQGHVHEALVRSFEAIYVDFESEIVKVSFITLSLPQLVSQFFVFHYWWYKLLGTFSNEGIEI